MTAQPDLFGDMSGNTGRAMPAGFRYQAGLIDMEEEAALIAEIRTLDLKPFEFQGYLANRRVASFGFRYDATRRIVEQVAPLPPALLALRERVGAFAGLPADVFGQALVSEYAPGAGIGWHRDKAQFGAVVGVSLLSPATFRLRRPAGKRWDRVSRIAEPRSAYLLSGEARTAWEHSIPAVESLRYSLTFRTLAKGFTVHEE